MTAGSDGRNAVAGGLARHIPVLVRPAIQLLNVRDDAVYVDATFGAGGYSREILRAAKCQLIAFDRDPVAIADAAELAGEYAGQLTLLRRRFSELQTAVATAGHREIDGVVFDLGISSMQLDDAARGFSFRLDGPLDMRMGSEGPTAADVIAAADPQQLARIIAMLGEERHARAVARAIVRARGQQPIRTTKALADLVAAVVHGRPGNIHPATRTFQALRTFVNEELNELVAGLVQAEQVLKPGGRLVVVAFQSLEDRIVKSFLSQRARAPARSRHLPDQRTAAPSFTLLTKRPVVPEAAEVGANPRARSAKLRAGERTQAEAVPASASVADLLPPLPALSDVIGRAR